MPSTPAAPVRSAGQREDTSIRNAVRLSNSRRPRSPYAPLDEGSFLISKCSSITFIMGFIPTTADVSFFLGKGQSVTLSTEQAEAIQHDTLMRIVEGAEVYIAGGKVQATYDWHGRGQWQLSPEFYERYVFQVQVKEIEREINSGLYYLIQPEETAFKLTCGLVVEHDEHDDFCYVLHGHQGGEIDRYDNVPDLAAAVADELAEQKK